MTKTHIKYKVVLKHFGFILLQTFQIILASLCIFLNWTKTIKLLKQIIDQNSFKDSKLSNCGKLILLTLLKVPTLISLLGIYMFRYKYHKKNQIMQKINDKTLPKNEEEYVIMECFGEQIVDSFYLIPIIVSTLFKPFNYKWLKLLIDENYNLKRLQIWRYFKKCIFDPFWIASAIILSILPLLYNPRHLITVLKGYYIIRKNMNILQIIRQESIYKKYTRNLVQKLKIDFPFLPLFFLLKANFFSLFDKSLTPQNSYPLLQKIHMLYYFNRVKRSSRFQIYQKLLEHDTASGNIFSQTQKLRFWKFANKTQRHIKFHNFIKKLLPKWRYEKVLKKYQQSPATSKFSSLSNNYWQQYKISGQLLKIFIFFIIEIIITIFGVVFLLPLTLWRLPTFIILYKIHNKKKYFFPIIGKIYIQMIIDIISLFPNIIIFLLSPLVYIRFIKNTAFKYPKQSIQKFQQGQKLKIDFKKKMIFERTLKIYLMCFMILAIYLLHIRKKQYRQMLVKKKCDFQYLKQTLLKGVNVPAFQQLFLQQFKNQKLTFGNMEQITYEQFKKSIMDVPYLLLSVIIFFSMPWRYHYLKTAFKKMRQDSNQRQQITKVMKNILKDYLCIFLNILLLLSIVKTKKAMQLIIRNYRLNFFIGFLKYSFLKDLTYELVEVFYIYKSFFVLIVALVLGWSRTDQNIKQIYKFYKRNKEEKQVRQQNQKIYKNTVKTGKQLRVLDKMGFNGFVTMAQFLDVKQLINLSKCSRFTYLMIDRQEIWIDKWQFLYSTKYQQEIKGATYRQRCINAYNKQNYGIKPIKITYHILVDNIFVENVFKKDNDLAILSKKVLTEPVYDKLFKNYTYQLHQGYGPENQLPQQEDQDEQFLRMTNQIRRRKVQMNESEFFVDWLLFKWIEKVVQLLNKFFRVDSKRKLKQFLFILLIAIPIYLYLQIWYNFWYQILKIDRFIAIKIILLVYFHFFMMLIFQRCQILKIREWVSLTPFDLYYDVVNFIKKVYHWLADKIIRFSKWSFKQGQKTANFIEQKIFTPTKIYVKKIITKIKNLVVKIGRFIKRKVTVVKDKVVYAGNLFVQKVAKPLYLSIVDKLIALKKVIVIVFKAIMNSFKAIYHLIVQILLTGVRAIRGLLSNFNKLYFMFLLNLRKFLMKFGIIGQLIFTIIGLMVMCSPSLICYFFYTQRWFIVVSTVHTMVLIVVSYRHLNKIKRINSGNK